jgi:hypothetical protein
VGHLAHRMVAIGFRAYIGPALFSFFALVHFWPNCCYNKPTTAFWYTRDMRREHRGHIASHVIVCTHSLTLMPQSETFARAPQDSKARGASNVCAWCESCPIMRMYAQAGACTRIAARVRERRYSFKPFAEPTSAWVPAMLPACTRIPRGQEAMSALQARQTPKYAPKSAQ